VHLYGLPCALDPLLEIAHRHAIPLIEDASQAHGALYKGRIVGSFGKAAAFSFYPGKNLGAFGEGGAFVTNDKGLADHARSLRDHGSTVRYYHDEIGYNYRMEGFQGAVLGVKLRYLTAWNASRRRVAKTYSNLLKDTPLKLPYEPLELSSACHLYVIRHPQRDELKKYLEQHEIGCALHYPVPLHLQKCYAGLDYKRGDFPVAERAAAECLSLPIYPELTDDKIDYVVEQIRNFFSTCKE
jgi:dTDP-4-amino-4,6-dideoxygalactose transaminase